MVARDGTQKMPCLGLGHEGRRIMRFVVSSLAGFSHCRSSRLCEMSRENAADFDQPYFRNPDSLFRPRRTGI